MSEGYREARFAEVASAMMKVRVEQVQFGVVLGLRQQILRPHQLIVDVQYPQDPVGTHFAAFDAGSAVIGVATLLPEVPTNESDPTWRLRGMAVAEEAQRQGVGRALMYAIFDFVSNVDHGGIWCAARLRAVEFYEKFDFATAGEPYIERGLGAHVRMERLGTGHSSIF